MNLAPNDSEKSLSSWPFSVYCLFSNLLIDLTYTVRTDISCSHRNAGSYTERNSEFNCVKAGNSVGLLVIRSILSHPYSALIFVP